MINREIPFRPRLEGEFRVRFYNAASEITEKTPTLTIARIAEREIEWVEKDCQYNIEQRKKYRAVWFLFRDLIRASWKACYRNGVIYMSLPTLNGTDMHDTTSPEVKALLRSWMSESRHERLVGYTDFINRMENPGTNKQSIAALIADGDELEKRIKRVHTGEIAEKLAPIVVVIDEFADLADQLETTKEKNAFYKPVQRIAQAGRSRGIHLVICTQRPEAKLVPSTTKAQLNGRVALRVNDGISSRMIIEEPDAQYLQKHGDMIYRNGDIIERAQGYLIEIEELDKIVDDVIHGRI